jgi:acyl-CoA synthetase (NDP forming)
MRSEIIFMQTIPKHPARNKAASNLISSVLATGRRVMLETESKELASLYAVPVPEFALATSVEDATRVASLVGYPVVLKIVSPDIVHKTEVGGVHTSIRNEGELTSAFEQISKSVAEKVPTARISGMLVQHMAPDGFEVIVGMTRDSQFGPMIMFGLGGIATEVFEDVAFGIAPLTHEQALDIVRMVRSYRLLSGFRGRPRVDISAIASTITKVAEIGIENEAVEQIDLNPLLVYERGLLAADARVILQNDKA